MDKKTAWGLLGALGLIQAGLLYFGINDLTVIIVPIATFLFGIATKTAVDKVINNKNNKKVE